MTHTLTPSEKGRLTRMAKADAQHLTGSRDAAKVIVAHESRHGATEATRYYAGAMFKVL